MSNTDNGIGDYYARKERERHAAHDMLVVARAEYAAAEARRPMGADGYPVLTDESSAAYTKLRRAERAYELAAYVGD